MAERSSTAGLSICPGHPVTSKATSIVGAIRAIEHGKVAEGKALIETQMILNHEGVIDLVVGNADAAAFNRHTLLNLHSALSENLLPNPGDEGRVRRHIVEIGRSVYQPLSVPAEIDEMLETLLDKANRITDPFNSPSSRWCICRICSLLRTSTSAPD